MNHQSPFLEDCFSFFFKDRLGNLEKTSSLERCVDPWRRVKLNVEKTKTPKLCGFLGDKSWKKLLTILCFFGYQMIFLKRLQHLGIIICWICWQQKTNWYQKHWYQIWVSNKRLVDCETAWFFQKQPFRKLEKMEVERHPKR